MRERRRTYPATLARGSAGVCERERERERERARARVRAHLRELYISVDMYNI